LQHQQAKQTHPRKGINQLEIEMSDYDNIREDVFDKRQEMERKVRDAAIEMHTENWITAVTKSPEKSNGTFDDVREYKGEKFDFEYVTRPANAVDVFIEELHNLDFMERAAAILISIQVRNANPQAEVSKLFQDMAANYAEYKYEKNFKE
jgi:hypothetical protein